MEELKKKLIVFAWGLVGAGLLAGITFLSGNVELIVSLFNLSPELQVIIIGVLMNITGQITKYLNQRFQLEEQIGRIGRKLVGRK